MDITPRPPAATDDIDWMLVVRYLAGECSPIEVGAVEAWVAGAPHRAERLRRLREASVGAPTREYHFDVDSAWGRLSTVPGVRQAEPTGPARPAARPRPWPRGVGGSDRSPARRLVPIGAAFAAGLAVAAIGFAAIRGYGRVAGRRMPYREYATSAGQRQTITLTDGTQFVLAPRSRLDLAAGYGARRREVYLDGEAYFAVTHDDRHPFVVHAGNGVAEDVGTHFTVRAYEHEPVTRVVVIDGAVSLADTSVRRTHRTMLTARTLGTVDHFGVMTATTGIDIEPYVAWTAGRLEFHATPMRTVVRELSLWYDLDVELADSTLGDRLCTGSYTSQSPDQVLSLITAAVGAQYERRGRTVTIAMQRANR